MRTVPIRTDAWRKASLSDGNDTCVEVHRNLDALRDSKCPTGPTLAVNANALVAAVKADRFSR
jgi:hypothetical protein